MSDRIMVHTGEKISVDGVVTSGEAAVDQASITGEFMPLSKEVGDDVFAGTVVKSGRIVVRARKVGDQTAVARIVHLVEEATHRKATVQSIADRTSAQLIPVNFLLCRDRLPGDAQREPRVEHADHRLFVRHPALDGHRAFGGDLHGRSQRDPRQGKQLPGVALRGRHADLRQDRDDDRGTAPGDQRDPGRRSSRGAGTLAVGGGGRRVEHASAGRGRVGQGPPGRTVGARPREHAGAHRARRGDRDCRAAHSGGQPTVHAGTGNRSRRRSPSPSTAWPEPAKVSFMLPTTEGCWASSASRTASART